MKRNTYYEKKYNSKELIYKLFRKKLCPICNQKMTHFNEQEDAVPYKGTAFGMGRSLTKMELCRVKDCYKCDNCGKVFSLEELARGEI